MKAMLAGCLATGLLLGIGACSSTPQGQTEAAADPQAFTRESVVAHAQAFANHRWSASEANAFHGVDEWGNRIDTPDTAGSGLATGWSLAGEPNQGVSYQWGGSSSIAEFEEGVAAGKWAGHLPSDGQSYFTPQAVGVDCSGLVTQVWRLPHKESTRSLPRFCRELASYDELLPGDILNLVDRHTMLFVEWVGADQKALRVIEATTREGRVHESVHERAELTRKGYRPLRYPALPTR